MGGQPGPSMEEEWGNQTLCRFLKPKQDLKERQLPLTENGTHITKVKWHIKDIHD